MSTYAVTDVFTPTSPARLAFVERKAVQDRLVDALLTPGKQIVVYGHSGSGKTTLLDNKLRQLYANHITTRCMVGMTFDQLLLDAFDQLASFFETSRTVKSESNISASVANEYLGIRAAISAARTETDAHHYERVVPPQLTPQRLARFLGEAGCCWVLEDFHKIEINHKSRLSQAMKVFMDMASDYRFVKMVAIGAVGTAREVVEYDQEMRNRVSEIFVPLMEAAEIVDVLDKGFSLLNLSLSPANKNLIVKYSNGLAAVAHQLALNTCFAAGAHETMPMHDNLSSENVQRAVERYIEEESDTIKHAFDKALRQKRGGRFDNCRTILETLSEAPAEGMTRSALMQEIKKRYPSYPEGNLSRYLKELATQSRGEIVRYDENSGLYSFSNPFHKAFAMASFDRRSALSASYSAIDASFERLLELLKRMG